MVSLPRGVAHGSSRANHPHINKTVAAEGRGPLRIGQQLLRKRGPSPVSNCSFRQPRRTRDTCPSPDDRHTGRMETEILKEPRTAISRLRMSVVEDATRCQTASSRVRGEGLRTRFQDLHEAVARGEVHTSVALGRCTSQEVRNRKACTTSATHNEEHTSTSTISA